MIFLPESKANSQSKYWFRKLKGPEVPASVLRCTNNPCDIYVVSKNNVIKRAANPLTFGGMSKGLAFFSSSYILFVG